MSTLKIRAQLRVLTIRLQANATQRRTVMMAATQTQTTSKREGDISSAFVSLSGTDQPPLPARFRELKNSLVSGREDRVIASWHRLLKGLQSENEEIVRQGSAVIPSIEFSNLESDLGLLETELQKRGVAVIRGVVPEQEARAYKSEIEEYVKKNPTTKAFPAHDPQVFELYWSAPQLKARSHPNLLRLQASLMKSLWHCSDPNALVSLSQPLAYADRLRIRQPGDASFALGPHQDGGSVERWEPRGYGIGGVYDAVFAGEWERYDAWDAATRVPAVMDLHEGLGACSMFRTFQGWLSMSNSGPNHGTLLVNPLLQMSTAYILLRPFFRPIETAADAGASRFLAAENWVFTGGEDMTCDLQGASPGHGQELTDALHPHLELGKTMVHMPEIKPGDFVIWHCDTIHSVDKVHAGTVDSSVLYIPVCPTTEINAKYLVRQREAFRNRTPGPDFPGGKGESEHVDRPTEELISGVAGRKAMGLEKLTVGWEDNDGARAAIDQANAILGF